MENSRFVFGPKVDLYKEGEDYRFKRYFKKFYDSVHSDTKILEFHLGNRDIDNPNLRENLLKISEFANENQVEVVGLHYPDNEHPDDVYFLNKTLNGSRLRKDEEVMSNQQAEDRFYRTLDLIVQSGFNRNPLFVMHQYGVQLESWFNKFSIEEINNMRKEHMNRELNSHKNLLNYLSGKVDVGIEVISLVDWADDEGALDGTVYEHFSERMKYGGFFILDTAHVAMNCHYKNQNDLVMKSMKSVESENPISLKSMVDFIRVCGPKTKWIHLADATGSRLKDEGYPIGTSESIIQWKDIFDAIKKYVNRPYMVLEIKNAHKDYDTTIGKSIEYLKSKSIIS